MEIRQMDIPKIGEKYTLKTSSGHQAIIIFYRSGRKEFHFMRENAEEPELGLDLKDEEARVIGALLLGIDYTCAQPDKSDGETGNLHDNILVEWLDLAPGSDLENQSISEAKVRSRTGVTVIGVERKGNMISSPDIHEKLHAGDRIMVTGSEEDIKQFEQICQGDQE